MSKTFKNIALMLYHWQATTSLLKEIELFKIGDQQEAFLYAPAQAEPQKLRELADGLRQRGFQAMPDVIDGKHVLRVEKFNDRSHLFSALTALGGIEGKPQISITKRDPKDKALSEKLKDSTMTLSGWLFTVGDALMVLSGAMRRDYAEAGTGLIWGSSGLVLALFGKKKPENQLATFYRNLEEHLKAEGIPLPKNEQDLVKALKRDSGIITRVQEFLENNPADFHHVVQSAGGTTLIKAGMNQKNWYKAAAGGFVTVGQAMGVLLPDKSHKQADAEQIYQPHAANSNAPATASDNKNPGAEHLPPEKDSRGTVARGWEWFVSNPLHFSGFFPFINNALNVVGAFRIEKPKVLKDVASIKAEEIVNLNKDITHVRMKLGQGITVQSSDLTSEFGKSITDNAKRLEMLVAEEARLNGVVKNVLPLSREKETFGAGHGAVTMPKKLLHSYQLNLATAGLYVAANLLYAVSKKDTSADLKAAGVIDEMTGILANVVAAAPDHLQAELTHQVAGYLGTQPDIKLTIQDVDKLISEKVAALRESPWGPAAVRKASRIQSPIVHVGPMIAAGTNQALQPGAA